MPNNIEITPLQDRTPLNEATINGQDGLVLQTNISAKEIFDERFKDLNKWSTKSCTIFKVNAGLRRSNSDAYTPLLISIGPYHKKNPQLCSMENYKLRYLQRFLQRNNEIDVKSYIRELQKMKDEVLKCYDDKVELGSYASGQFLEMLLLDGCFVVEYLREVFKIFPEGEDKIINADWMVNLIDRDLLLLENQLPFLVLTKLHDMTKYPTESFIKMVKYNFCGSLPRVTPKFLYEANGNVKGIKHLLQVVHMCGTGRPEKPYSLTFESELEPQIIKDANLWHDLMRSATELDEAGINFSKVSEIYRMLGEDNRGDNTSLFDIKYNNGRMKIPCFEVVNGTETVLRNLVAYEQHSSDVYTKYFTDYVIFMDRLINAAEDVKLLRMKEIIRNRIGDDSDVASIFNKLGDGVIPSSNFYYKEECKKVVEHCNKRWNRRMANLRHNYFNGPWVGLSTAAAVFLLVLTLMQTVLTFISTL
ncbi:UPF0481 protein At3g47200-like [Nicotiana sylvestris]|uniref:UPF0481 protein At3g02645 n=1 Tax=Nicotiana sylvestris TaxID=4096 RepID=A0A1U7X507_NICSY|nr:PREDICTED: putative UPF0481 protein At3g02645 [Nicotiana sylvestris]XP_009781969.1 PREDICTED: putative UPF0481 protein At3g02645 [Nicotiana sylvestris]